jgi:hypothetical protein
MSNNEYILLGIYNGFYLFSCNLNGYGCFRLLPNDASEIKHDGPIWTWPILNDKPKRTKCFMVDIEWFPVSFPIEDYWTA